MTGPHCWNSQAEGNNIPGDPYSSGRVGSNSAGHTVLVEVGMEQRE